MKMIFGLSVLLLIIAPFNIFGIGSDDRENNEPSFDCANAKFTAEKLICSDNELSKLDQRLSDIYGEAKSTSTNFQKIKAQQKKWILQVRNKCNEIDCLKKAYLKRINEISKTIGVMTTDKANSICSKVVKQINDGSIINRFNEFTRSNDLEKQTLKFFNSSMETLSLSGIFQFKENGTVRTLGYFVGGGTCGSCDVWETSAVGYAPYPNDDEEEHLRWASWGHCDFLIFVEGEPVVVTGSFTGTISEATLVSWIASDGAKRPLCYLKPNGDIRINTVLSENRELCIAVKDEMVEKVLWEPPSISLCEEPRTSYPSCLEKETIIDIDLDGRTERIGYFGLDSGAGCGSREECLRELSVDGQSISETVLSDILHEEGRGPIYDANKDSIFKLGIIKYREKPYIVSAGGEYSARILSTWSNETKTWCGYILYPQHKIIIRYPLY